MPKLIKDVGVGSAYFDALNLNTEIIPFLNEKQLGITIHTFQLELLDLNLVLRGGELSAIVT